MHILLTGAAGMIGRKLTARLIANKKLNGKPIERLTLLDVSAPERPENFSAHGRTPALLRALLAYFLRAARSQAWRLHFFL